MPLVSRLVVLTLTGAALNASIGAQAQSIDVRVIGTITPASCLPALVGGGVIDYGIIPAASLNRTAFTVLPEKDMPFSISCTTPTRVALRAADNREASRVVGIPAALNSGFVAATNFGLGSVAGANVGGYVMRMRQGSFTADSSSAFTVINTISGIGAWSNTNFGIFQNVPTFRLSWSRTLAGPPVAFSTLSGTLTVQTALNRGDALPLTGAVPLDGLATLELVYL